MLKFKRLKLALCVLAVSGSTWATPTLIQSERNIEEYQLDNGLKIILSPNEKESKVYMNTVYFTGSLDDPKGKGGLAHLLEHLLFKGTQNVPDDEFQRRLDQNTLMTNAMTGFHFTSYINVLPADQNKINQLIHLEAERMDKSVIKMQHVPNEIEIVKREREIRLDQPGSVVRDQIFKELYGNQSLGRAPIGDLEELKSISLNELQQFYKTWYKPNNAAIIITGKFDKQATLAQIEQQFSSIQPAQSFPVRASTQVPEFKFENLKNRHFKVQKGSDYVTMIGYLGAGDTKIQNQLSVAGTLFSMEPSGRLYQSLVKNKQATGVGGHSDSDKYYNFVMIGASYAPQHDRNHIEKTLITQIEQSGDVAEDDVKRVRLATRNALQTVENDAVAFGSMLMQYVVSSDKGWLAYFDDVAELEKLQAKDVNATYQKFFDEQKRIVIDIEPTPEALKQAQQKQASTQQLKSTQVEEVAEPLKDVQTYIDEQKHYLAESKNSIDGVTPKLISGQFKNGLRYTFYPTELKDNKVYATLTVGIATHSSLHGKAEVLESMASQLLRGSKTHTLQQVVDKNLELNGSAHAKVSGNKITIHITADKQNFAEYLAFVLDMLKQPAFDVEDFEVNKSTALADLERPYTEPSVVSSLVLDRVTEIYPQGDLFYHFEPEVAKAQLNAVTNEQLKQFYNDYFAMNHAHLTITGEFDVAKTQKVLQKQLAKWKTKQPYQRAIIPYQPYKSQKIHALAEQREFGSYQSYLTIPVGIEDDDAMSLLILSHILGGSQLSSRLGQELREKNNLVYGFNHDLDLSSVNSSGSWSVSANYKPELAEQVSQAIHKTINDLLEKGVTEQEVEAGKAHLLKSRATAMKDDKRVHSMLVAQQDLKRNMQSRIERDNKIAQVTKADVERVAKKYLQLNQLIEVMADQYGQPVEMPKSKVE